MCRRISVCKFQIVKTILCAMMIVLVSASGYAQYTGYKPLQDIPAFKKHFAEESASIQTITADFKQEKILTALTEKITSTGKFWFKRANKVRIDYEHPFVYRLVLNGDKILIKDDQKESTVNVKSNKLFQQVNRIMIDCVQGTILESKDFTSRVFENEKTYLLEMTPASKTLKEFFSTITLVVEKKDYTVSTLEMNEPAGDKTIMVFQHKKLNAALSDEVFKL